jgi:hypothetical protein
MAATLGIVISLLVLGGPERDFTATAYSDVIRFEAQGVATLQVRIFDLSGKEVWDSGMVSGDIVDWDRRNDFGERLAYGAYIYSAQGWNAQGDLIFQKNGKLALMPGDKVQLQAAPVPTPVSPFDPLEDQSLTVQPKGLGDTGIFGTIGIGVSTPQDKLHVARDGQGGAIIEAASSSYFYWRPTVAFRRGRNTISSPSVVQSGDYLGSFTFGGYDGSGYWPAAEIVGAVDGSPGSNSIPGSILFRTTPSGSIHPTTQMSIDSSGNVGIGTSGSGVTAKLTIEASSGDLIAAYNSTNRVFVVKSTGEVRADGAYYSGAGDCNTGGFNAGGADVAERINVSEWVEAGCVVEIDPEHPGFFRKPSSPYSTKVAGIISTSPGVILGNNFDEATDDWEDNRPVLAIAGRVPLKVTSENGSIQIGDLLVSSSTPGVAMRGDPAACMGAVIGKAMEQLKEGEGTIVVQVMLR